MLPCWVLPATSGGNQAQRGNPAPRSRPNWRQAEKSRKRCSRSRRQVAPVSCGLCATGQPAAVLVPQVEFQSSRWRARTRRTATTSASICTNHCIRQRRREQHRNRPAQLMVDHTTGPAAPPPSPRQNFDRFARARKSVLQNPAGERRRQRELPSAGCEPVTRIQRTTCRCVGIRLAIRTARPVGRAGG